MGPGFWPVHHSGSAGRLHWCHLFEDVGQHSSHWDFADEFFFSGWYGHVIGDHPRKFHVIWDFVGEYGTYKLLGGTVGVVVFFK